MKLTIHRVRPTLLHGQGEQGDREGRPYHTRLLQSFCPYMVRATLAVALAPGCKIMICTPTHPRRIIIPFAYQNAQSKLDRKYAA